MPSLKALRSRIKSVKNTRQITKTMKMVAAAKVRRARAAVESARPYAQGLATLLATLANNPDADQPLLIQGRSVVKTVRLIVCGSDRGLCGSLNSNLLKAAAKWVAQQQAAGLQVQLVAVGRKMRDGLRSSHGPLLIASHVDLGRAIEFSHAQMLAQQAQTDFLSGACDRVEILSSQLVTMLSQVPVVTPLLPLAAPASSSAVVNEPECEPSAGAVLSYVLPRYLDVQMFTALLETNASEQAARMTAMDSATRNAGEMIKKLSVQYNRSRQASITKELIEIISGAEAL